MIDREKVKAELDEIVEQCRGMGYIGFSMITEHCQNILALLKEQETANLYKCPNCGTWVSAENVVRCKDCKHGDLWSDENVIVCDKLSKTRDKNWFCADGERK